MAISRYIKFEKQGSYTDETFTFGTNKHIVDPIGEDISGDPQKQYPRTAGQRNVRKHVKGNKKFTGTLNVPLYPIHAASLLYYGLGSVTTAVGSPTTTNKHTIKIADSIPAFKAAIGREIKEHQYVGGIVNGFTIDYTPGEVLASSFDVVFRRELSPLGNLDTGATFADFDVVEAPFSGAEITPKFNDTSVTFVESASITVENNLDADAFAVGSEYLPAAKISEFRVSGSFDLRYDDSQRYTDWLNDTALKLDLDATHGTGNSTRILNLQLPVVSYDSNSLPTDNIERYVQTLEFTGETDSNGDPIIIVVQNEQTSAQFSG